MKISEKEDNGIIKCLNKYGNEFLCSYITWVANGGADDFSNFPDKIQKSSKLIISIKKRVAKIIKNTCSEKTIDSNYFKKDKMYRELRAELDKDDELKQEIKKYFIDENDH